MAYKHQIWSGNKITRNRAGRKWRRQDKQFLSQYQYIPSIKRKRKYINDNTPTVHAPRDVINELHDILNKIRL